MVGFDAATPYVAIALLGTLLGASGAFGILTSAAGAVAEFAPQDARVASGIFNSIRQVGSALGVAIPAAAFDLVAGGAFSGEIVFDGVRWALAARAIVMALAVVLAGALLLGSREAMRAAAAVHAAQRA